MSTPAPAIALVPALLPDTEAISAIVRLALAEDVGRGDLTTEATAPPAARAVAEIRQKQEGVLCGLPVVERVFRAVDPAVQVLALAEEGSWGDRRVVARIEGSARAVLIGERTALNFLGRLSGVATMSRRAAQRVVGTSTRVLDTRKTTPGHRALEKYAVRVGGCHNHRGGLDDGILIKENHIRAAGGITAAVSAALRRTAPMQQVEVEVTKWSHGPGPRRPRPCWWPRRPGCCTACARRRRRRRCWRRTRRRSAAT